MINKFCFCSKLTVLEKKFCWENILGFLLVTLFLMPSIASSGSLSVGGTGSSLGTMRHMAQAFMKKFPNEKVMVLPSLGSSGGIKALINGAIELSFSGRPLKEKEKKAGCQHQIYSKTPFVIGVNSTNSISRISLRDLEKIYNGELIKWSDGTIIRLIMRNKSESDTKFLRSISSELNNAVDIAFTRKGLTYATNDQDSATKIENIPGTIGPTTLTQIISENRAIKPLMLKGIIPSTENIANGTYKFYRSLYLISHVNPSAEAKRFTSFIFSKEGRTILQENGNLYHEI